MSLAPEQYDEIVEYLFSIPHWQELPIVELLRRADAYQNYLELRSSGKVL